DWIWVGIASEAKLRGENNDEQRPDTNTKKHQADPQKARHTSVGRSCDFAHIRKLHLTSIRPQKFAIKGRQNLYNPLALQAAAPVEKLHASPPNRITSR